MQPNNIINLPFSSNKILYSNFNSQSYIDAYIHTVQCLDSNIILLHDVPYNCSVTALTQGRSLPFQLYNIYSYNSLY